MAQFRHPTGLGMGLDVPNEEPSVIAENRYGPLRHSTRLAWPEE